MASNNAAIAKVILIVILSLFVYYVFWVSVLPFMLIDEGKCALVLLGSFAMQTTPCADFILLSLQIIGSIPCSLQ